MAKQDALPRTLPPRLVDRDAAAAYVSLSPGSFDLMVRQGRMPRPRKLLGRRIAWDLRHLDKAVDALPIDGEDLASVEDGSWDD